MKFTGMIFLSLYLILGEALAIEPVGTIGKEGIRLLTFLPDGNMLRARSKHIEIVDPDNDVVIATFAESSEFLGLVIVSPDGGSLSTEDGTWSNSGTLTGKKNLANGSFNPPDHGPGECWIIHFWLHSVGHNQYLQ